MIVRASGRVGVVPQTGGDLPHLVLQLTSLTLVKFRRCLVTTMEDQVNKTRNVQTSHRTKRCSCLCMSI
jgi:hypothetical protein